MRKLLALPSATLCFLLLGGCGGCSSGGHSSADSAAGAIDGGDDSGNGTDAASDSSPADAGSPGESGVAAGWLPVSTGGICTLNTADANGLDTFSPFAWASCGPGCRVADAVPPGFVLTSQRQSSGEYRNGDTFLRLLHSRTASVGGSALSRIVRLSDGKTVAALDIPTGGCYVPAGGTAAAWFVPLLDATSSKFMGGSISDAASPLTFSDWLPVVGLVKGAFQLQSSFGLALASGAVLATAPGSPSSWTTLAVEQAPPEHPLGRGGLLLWIEPGTGGSRSLREYAADAGSQTLVGGAASVMVATLSDDKVVWITGFGPQAYQHIYTSAEFDWAAIPTAGTPIAPTKGPSLPYARNLDDLQSSGDYAATIGCAADAITCEVAVVRISTGALTSLRPRPGKSFNRILAMSPSEMVLSEADSPATSGEVQLVRRLMRIDLTQLAELALSW